MISLRAAFEDARHEYARAYERGLIDGIELLLRMLAEFDLDTEELDEWLENVRDFVAIEKEHRP